MKSFYTRATCRRNEQSSSSSCRDAHVLLDRNNMATDRDQMSRYNRSNTATSSESQSPKQSPDMYSLPTEPLYAQPFDPCLKTAGLGSGTQSQVGPGPTCSITESKPVAPGLKPSPPARPPWLTYAQVNKKKTAPAEKGVDRREPLSVSYSAVRRTDKVKQPAEAVAGDNEVQCELTMNENPLYG